MLGIGETIEELFAVLADLRAVACDTPSRSGSTWRQRSSTFLLLVSSPLGSSITSPRLARTLGFQESRRPARFVAFQLPTADEMVQV